MKFHFLRKANASFFMLGLLCFNPFMSSAQSKQASANPASAKVSSKPTSSGNPSATAGSSLLDLAGEWSFKMDPQNEGVENKWYGTALPGKIHLPGSMTTNHLGNEVSTKTIWTGSILDSSYFHSPAYARYREPGNIKVPFWLQPEKYYRGAAWYQKTVTIPASWKGKHLQLFLERPHWQTTLWIDDQQLGSQNSLGTAHVYNIPVLTPGKHQLTIRVDNEFRDLDVGQNSHSVSDHTQTNWNGLVGKLYLKAIPDLSIDNIQLYPDINNKQVVVEIKLNNQLTQSTNARISLRAIPDNNPSSTAQKPSQQTAQETSTATNKLTQEPHSPYLASLTKSLPVSTSDSVIRITYPMGASPLLWSESHPNLYRMKVTLTAEATGSDQRDITFGMREFSAEGTHFTINGVPAMLRGTLECAVFPLTGYPPTDLKSWLKEFSKCKDYGLNHLRFHSWCPPEAAFEAADRLGLYLQIECSSWGGWTTTIGDGGPLDKYLYEESTNIIKAYGNHPSFCLLAYGNEPSGKHLTEYLQKFVTYWKEHDPRRLYTTGSGWPIVRESNYNSSGEPRIAHGGPILRTVINGKPPASDYDWSGIIAQWPQPTVSHEIGQWCVYPDFSEIPHYTGVLKARNFEIFRDTLEKNGLGAYAKDFLYASGKLQALCYKADIEAALRTKGFGGFQLLSLSDFPGQGTALVGVLNAFWEDKSYMTAALFSQFCNKVVPLVRLKKMIYNNDETLDIPVEAAQFSETILKNSRPAWTIRTDSGRILFKGELASQDIPVGNGISLGEIKQSLSSVLHPSRLILTIAIGQYQNTWDLFVYPAQNPPIPSEKNTKLRLTNRYSPNPNSSSATHQESTSTANPAANQVTSGDVYITQDLDAKTWDILQQGGKVLLTLKKGALKKNAGGDINIAFSSIFWNTAWVKGTVPYTLGIWCDPNHPALKLFPTQSYSNWQWWDAMSHSNAIKLDSISKGLKPIVRVIDDWFSARSLGLIFECRAGNGKLLVSGIDLLSDADQRPEARQLLYSLQSYMSTSRFAPAQSVDIAALKLMLE